MKRYQIFGLTALFLGGSILPSFGLGGVARSPSPPQGGNFFRGGAQSRGHCGGPGRNFGGGNRFGNNRFGNNCFGNNRFGKFGNFGNFGNFDSGFRDGTIIVQDGFVFRDGVLLRDGLRGRNRFGNGANDISVNVGGGGWGDWGGGWGGYGIYPPWYRLNYYAPWMSDYENGTAWTNIPTSHAAEAYAFPGTYLMPPGYAPSVDAMAVAYGQAGGYAQGGYPGYGGYAQPGYPQQPGYGMPRPNPNVAGLDVVVGVQRELRRRGFYQGVVNGLSDGATRAAIRAYESSVGLPVTGVIGIPLLRSLGFF